MQEGNVLWVFSELFWLTASLLQLVKKNLNQNSTTVGHKAKMMS